MTMKTTAYLFAALFLLTACGGETETEVITPSVDSTQQVVNEVLEVEEETPAPPKSPRLESSGVINGVETSIAFGSPFVKNREIWGGLIPYDKIWRAGANDATAITFAQPVLVEGNNVAAGTYALFIIPKENADWTVILNEEWSKEEHGVWGAYDHKPEKDVLRFEVTPTFENQHVESLTFAVEDKQVKFEWEKAQFTFKVEPKK